MSQIAITVNETPLSVENGALLIEVLIKHGFEIPYFCYHEALGPDGNCRMCMVEIEGQKRPQIACDTFAKEGMIVRTHGENIDAVRRRILELELINHPVDCPICDQAGECKLQDFYMDYGLYDSDISKSSKQKHQKHIDLGSNVMLDQERCVLCARCTRFTGRVTKTHELGIIGRGDHARISTMPGKKLDNPYAMNVVDLCPVGALTSKDFRFHQRVWFMSTTPSVCHGCSKGCNISIDHNQEKYKEDTIYRFRPRLNHEINGYFMCDYGRLSYKTLQANRQREALIDAKSVTVEEALEALNDAIADAKSIAIIADPNLYCEELEALVAFAAKQSATLCSPLNSYVNEGFADEWLKESMMCANAKAVEMLGISQEVPDGEFDLLININHLDASRIKAKKWVSFVCHKSSERGIVLPLANYTESEGSVINSAGIKQHSQKALQTSQIDLLSYLKRVDEGGEL